MPGWTFESATTGGVPRGALTAATSRKLTVRLDGPPEASFSIDGRHEQALLIGELTSDLVVSRGQDKLYRGRVGKTQDTGSRNAHTVSVNSIGYRGMLGRRDLRDGGTLDFAGVDQEEIGWQLIADTQARVGGALGITRGVDQSTGILRTRAYEPGKDLGDALDQLSDVSNGFDWEIDADLVYRVWYPQRGTDVDGERMVLDFDGTVDSFSRTVNPDGFVNAARVTGAEGLDPEERESADLATAAEGRFDASFGYPDITLQDTLAERADWHLAEGETLRPAWSLTLRPGAWEGPDHLWLGDTAQLVVRSGRLDVVTHLRVFEMAIDVDDNDDEMVRVGLGRAQLNTRRRNRLIEQRIRGLERR